MKRHQVLLLALWLAGAAVAAWLTPAGPRDGWQPPAGQWVAGFLADGRTLATVTCDAGPGHTERGPLRLWDMATGEPRGEVALPDSLTRAMMIDGTDRVGVQGVEMPPTGPPEWTMVSVDARTGDRGPTLRASPVRNNPWWMFADAGRTVAVNTVAGDQPAIDVFDVRIGERRCRVAGGEEPLSLTADGRRLACRHGTDIAVFDLPAAREVARFAPDAGTKPGWEPTPIAFSPDGTLLIDDACRVFDLAAGRERFRVADGYSSDVGFTADGATLIVTTAKAGESALELRDARTGDHRPGSHRVLLTAQRPHMSLRPGLGRDVVALAGQRDRWQPAWADRLPADLPGVAWLTDARPPDVGELIRSDTGERVWRGAVEPWGVTPDGRGMLVVDRRANRFTLWDIPPRRPWRWVAAAVAAWTAALAVATGGAAWWRRRRR